MRKIFILSSFFLFLFIESSVSQSISLSNLFASNMVLQQDMQTPLWGWGQAGGQVQITASWGQVATATTDVNGKWKTTIQTPKAIPGQAPKYTLTFQGANNTITLSNVLVGDVWLCSGQSNMAFPMTGTGNPFNPLGVIDYPNEIAAANYPNIRLYSLNRVMSLTVVENAPSTSWLECNPTNIAKFSAVAYYFGREIYNRPAINIPIGLIVSAYGGSGIQAWMNRQSLENNPTLNAKYIDPFNASPTLVATSPTVLFSSMLSPLVGYGIKGFLWYQGEANSADASDYFTLNSVMLKDWRSLWGQGDLPFYYAQVAPYGPKDLPTWTNYATLRDKQCQMLSVSNTGMAVTMDVGDLTNIHPRNKKDVGKRLAYWALAKTYNQNLIYTGPIYKSKKIEGSKIRISFHPASVGSGLAMSSGTALNCFSVSGSGGIMVDAVAEIDGNDILVSAAAVPAPINVRFAYTNISLPNLMNKEGLPASPFRTDTWDNSINIDETNTGIEKLNADFDSFANISQDTSNQKIHIKFYMTFNTLSLNLVDLSGKKVISNVYKSSEDKIDIDVSQLLKGVYIVNMTSINMNLSKKIIII